MRHSIAPIVLAAALSLAGSLPAAAKDQAAAQQQAPPRLVVAISIDQFSADLFAQYRDHFTQGLARLQQGAVFPSAYQAHAATETCPGHSTLLTGARPARTGIIANFWFDMDRPGQDKRVYCAEDESDPASKPDDPVVSPAHLNVPTLGDRLKRANPASRNVAVSAKDRAVVMMGGHVIDEGYWWKGAAFTGFRGKPLAPAVQAVNRAAAKAIKSGARAMAAPAWCAARDRAVPVADFTVGTGRFAMKPGQPNAFRISPRIDAATVDLAVRLVDAMKLGQGAAPDVLSVSLSATDYIGHAYGSQGLEMCIQMAELDKAVGRLLAHLDARRIDYAVVLSADHGGSDLLERLVRQSFPEAGRADAALSPRALGQAIAERTGIAAPGGWLVYADGPYGDYYLAGGLSADQRQRVLAELVALLKANPQVAAVFTAKELADTPMPPAGAPQEWNLSQRARASFDPRRSGDVVALLNRGISPIITPTPPYTSSHGSAWDYDRRVPLLFWRRGLQGFEQPAPVETVDIAPTLAALLGLAVPQGSFDGRCLDIDGSAANTCEAMR